jgi:F0F1-type ATP synthase membrane subunit b/b'
MKSWRLGLLFLQCGLFTVFLSTLPALAAEGANQDPADSPTGLIFRWLNFLIVFGGLAYLIAKHGGAFFRGNAKAIAASIHEATAAKAEAERELSEVERKIAHLDQEIAELRVSARSDSAAEAERLRTSGRAEIEKINQAARGELDASGRAAQQELRAIAAALAVDLAGVIIKSRINTEFRARMFHSFLGELGRSRN